MLEGVTMLIVLSTFWTVAELRVVIVVIVDEHSLGLLESLDAKLAKEIVMHDLQSSHTRTG